MIETIEIPDAKTVTLNLSAPHAALLPYLARAEAQIVSKSFLEDGGDLNLEMMGTGPFKFVSREPGVSIVLERNPDYYEAGKPYLDGIVFIPYAGRADAGARFRGRGCRYRRVCSLEGHGRHRTEFLLLRCTPTKVRRS